MTFPDTPRVLYRTNPLLDVTCELRFPTILRIEAETPATYQESIRAKFPLFAEGNTDPVPGMPDELRKHLPPGFGAREKRYQFQSEDKKLATTLSRSSLVLMTTDYEEWKRFRETLNELLAAFCAAYEPLHFTRIGLRYKNVIDRDKLNLHNVPWSDLLENHIAAEFTRPEISTHIETALRQLGVRLDTGEAHIRHGLCTTGDSKEYCYLIDADFFLNSKTEVTNAIDVLNKLHQEAGRFFRWCINDRLHDALGPEEIPNLG